MKTMLNFQKSKYRRYSSDENVIKIAEIIFKTIRRNSENMMKLFHIKYY